MPLLTPARYGQWALVAGGSTGIGYAIADQLAARGFDIAIVGRNSVRLATAVQSLRDGHGVKVDTIAADLANPGGADTVLDWLGTRTVGVYATTAGEGSPGDFVDGQLEDFMACVNVKIASTLTLTHALAGAMRERGAGAILLTSSTGALQGVPSLAANAAAEAYVLSFAEALHHELKPHGVAVTSLMPGPTLTDGLRRMVPNESDLPRGVMTAAATAAEGIRALERGKASHIAGAHNRMLLGVLTRPARTALMGRMIGSLFAKSATASARSGVAA